MKRRSLRQICTDAFRLLLNDIKSAKWAIALVIAYFVFGRKILHSMCPMVVLTGFPCPACGLTRAGCAMLGLDFKGAWQLHPFIYPIAALLVCWCAGRYIRYAVLHDRVLYVPYGDRIPGGAPYELL